jgi:hypothetical protein
MPSSGSPASVAQQRGCRVLARIAAKEPLLVGQQHQHVGLNQVGDERTERVVVPEPDFVGRDRVVFVDDRNHTETEQREQRRARVEITAPVREIFMRQENLRGVQVEARERGFISLHQSHLTDRGRGLQLVHALRPLLPSQPLHALDDRAARHQQYAAPGLAQPRLLGPPRDRCVVDATAAGGHEAKPPDHRAARRRQRN